MEEYYVESEVKPIEIREDHISSLICGKRPEGMDYQEFRLKRKAIQRFIKNNFRIFYHGEQPYRKPSEV